MPDAGVVDQYVEASDLGDGGGDGRGAGNVEWEGVCRGPDGVGEGFGGGEIEVGDPDGCACADEFPDGGFADAAGAAGEEGVAFVETDGGGWIHGNFAGGWVGVVHGWRVAFTDTVPHWPVLRACAACGFGNVRAA